MPGAERFDDLGGDAEGRVDLAVDGFGISRLADLKYGAIAGGKHHGDELMSR